MKLKRDAITGIVGLVWSAIWLFLIQTQTKNPANLLEPGPRLLPYVAFVVVFCSSLMLTISGVRASIKANKPEKPYFPKGGKLKITKSYLLLCAYAAALAVFGFIVSTPFATFAFIYDLKGETKVKPIPTAIISLLVTAGLYAMFVIGFQVKLPAGILFG